MVRTSNRSIERKEKVKLNKIQKAIASIIVLAILALSTGAILMQTNAALPPNNVSTSGVINSLVNPGTLTIWGSSTVGPIAQEELTTSQGNFAGYWNGLVSSHAVSSSAISAVSLSTLGSGTAVPALASLSGDGPADIGEMSRPPLC